MRQLVQNDIEEIQPEYSGKHRIIHVLILQRSGGKDSKQVHSDPWRTFGIDEIKRIKSGIDQISRYTRVSVVDLGKIPIKKQVFMRYNVQFL